MTKPTIVFVPGMWEGAAVFIPTALKLQELGYNTSIATLPSLGQSSPCNINQDDDITAVRSFIEPFVQRAQNVVLVCHSFGGALGPAAIKGLTAKERQAEGKTGGVVAIAFVCAAVFPVGTVPGALPFFDIQGGAVHCKSPRELLFNDLQDESVAERWLALMQPMPSQNYFTEIKHAGWTEVPCHFLLCENDKLLPADLQQSMAERCRAKVTGCNAGHMVQISQSHTLAAFVSQSAQEVN